MLLIVGLGNPGDNYEITYHNAGFMCVDTLSKNFDVKIKKNKCQSLIFEGVVLGKKVVFAKPQTFMNNSGVAIKSLMQNFKVEPEKTLIIFDDIDTQKGKIRFRKSGSGGTHNGMKSVVKECGENVNRLRIGVMPTKKPYNLADYVLSSMDKASKKEIENAIEKSISLIEEFIEQDGQIENLSE